MLRLALAALLLLQADAGYFDGCAPGVALNIMPATSIYQCPEGAKCDPRLLVVEGCVMTCKSGAVRFLSETGWTVASEKVTYKASLNGFVKSAGGISFDMMTPNCVIDPSLTTTTATTTTTPSTTTQPAIATTTPPQPVLEKCGCPYSVDFSGKYDNYNELYIQDTAGSGNGNCTVQCDADSRLVSGNIAMSSVSCKNGAWSYVDADTNAVGSFNGKMSCRQVFTPKCPLFNASMAAVCRNDNLNTAKPCWQFGDNGVRPIAGAKSSCILGCGKFNRLYEATLKIFLAELYYDTAAGKWKGKPLGDVTSTITFSGLPSVMCEKYYQPSEQARLPPDGALTACGCPYQASPCPTCDWKQLYVLEGVPGSFRCTLGCAKGYVLLGGATNLISCKKNTWIGTSRTDMSVVSVPRDNVWLTTSCVPADKVGTCSAAYTTFDCEGCDKSKIVQMSSTKGKCNLACDKGWRLVYMDSTRVVTRAQEAVLQDQWTVYLLGEIATPVTVATAAAQFSCEPAVPIPAAVTAGPACGCPYSVKSCASCDNSKLIGRHDGAGTCTLSCAPGYQMISDNAAEGGALTAATCTFYKWFARTASLTGSFTSAFSPAFGCVRTATAKCLSAYSPLSACTVCDATKLAPRSTQRRCQLGCAAGFRLVANTANWISSATRYSELSTSDADVWSGVTLAGTVANLPALFVGCEPDPPTKPLAKCGCNFTSAGPEWGKLVPRTVWPDGNNCELICEPGYSLKYNSYSLSLAVCQAGKWTARDFTGANTISMGTPPPLGCVKATTDYIQGCSSPNWLPLQCTGCSVEALMPVPSGYTCQFTCRAGWRLVAQHPANTIVTRPRAVSLKGGEWIGTGGQGLLTTLYYGVQPLISCEPDTYPPPADPAAVPKPPPKPCEYCKLPTAQAACPVGKTCTPEFLPLWKTAAGCMQVRCQTSRTMLINKSNAWITTDALNCEADGKWKTATGVAMGTADVAVTCDAKTGGTTTFIEVIYNIYRKGIQLIALDPNYKTTVG